MQNCWTAWAPGRFRMPGDNISLPDPSHHLTSKSQQSAVEKAQHRSRGKEGVKTCRCCSRELANISEMSASVAPPDRSSFQRDPKAHEPKLRLTPDSAGTRRCWRKEERKGSDSLTPLI